MGDARQLNQTLSDADARLEGAPCASSCLLSKKAVQAEKMLLSGCVLQQQCKRCTETIHLKTLT